MNPCNEIKVDGASEHNLKGVTVTIPHGKITVITGVSGSGKSSLAFDTILAESQRRFFYTLSQYSRQFLDLGSRPLVKHISGLSPAIGLTQNETQPSRKATVGSLMDLSEIVGVFFSRLGERMCPKHKLPTAAVSLAQIVERVAAECQHKTIALAFAIAEKKKGHFEAQLESYLVKGYRHAVIDDEFVPLDPLPHLDKEKRHSISIVVDFINIKEKNFNRLERSIGVCLELGNGDGEYYHCPKPGTVDLGSRVRFSRSSGCTLCGFSWPKLDARHFSANSLGRCQSCNGYGYLSDEGEEQWEWEECPECDGIGIDPHYRNILIANKSIHDWHSLPVSALREILVTLLDKAVGPVEKKLMTEMLVQIDRLISVHLGWIHSSRRVWSLSRGESQRLRLATVLGGKLRNILYVLDEPSQGLHPAEIESLWESLLILKDLGNTILLVDHDETLLRKADQIIDLGPGGGRDGGQLMGVFHPDSASEWVSHSETASYLVKAKNFLMPKPVAEKNESYITITRPKLHNLKMDKVSFPINKMTVVSGVSGSGKSTLALSVLWSNLKNYLSGDSVEYQFCDKVEGLDDLRHCYLVDRKPIAKTSVSMPVTWLKIFSDLRSHYSSLPEAQIRGLTQRDFSLSIEGGRCSECSGKGYLNLSMKFLADATIQCPTCLGKRYQEKVLGVVYNGLSLSEVLDLTIAEAADHFQTFRSITKKLKPALDLGLGYLKLGQPSSSLSGGESQRLKLAQLMSKTQLIGSVMILDEPTTGLHFKDVDLLISQFRSLVDRGTTIILSEHNVSMIMAADWIVDLGPGGGQDGGNIVFAGQPSLIIDCENSKTAGYLN